MIAQQKPRPSAPEESTAVGLPDNIFAGLQFPSVPTTRPVYNPKPTSQPSATSEVKQGVEQSVELRTVKPASKPIDSRALSVLYQSEPADSSHIYPSIPTYRPTVTASAPQVGTMLSPPINTSPEMEESQPLLTSQSNADVFLDVFTENQRLIEELNRLQRDMQDNDSVTPTVVRSSSASNTGQRTPHIHISAPSSASVAHGQQQTQQSPQTNDVGLKYVCCGSCRQWLSSPRDAAYVYCPNCQAINNCLPQQAEAPQRLPPRRLESTTPWYLQCFERIWS